MGKKKKTSWCWRGLWLGKEVLKENYVWHIGDGSKINIWRDAWIRLGVFLQDIIGSSLNNVRSLIERDTRSWNDPVLREFFDVQTVRDILAIPLGRVEGEVTLI